jgi:hypothetical protein
MRIGNQSAIAATCFSSLAEQLQSAVKGKDLPDLVEVDLPQLPFTILDTPGYLMCMMAMKVDDMDISVKFQVPQRLRSERKASTLLIPFNVMLTRVGRGAAVVECITDIGGSFHIRNLRIIQEHDLNRNVSQKATIGVMGQYPGPYLDIMPEKFQDALISYLNECGINPTLCRFIQQYAKKKKEPMEYIRWVNGLHKYFFRPTDKQFSIDSYLRPYVSI